MSEKHSPGPFTVDARCGDLMIVDADLHYVGRIYSTESDARLIAAAPELLAALEDLLGWDNCECGHPSCKRGETATAARRLIRRIEGEG